MKEMSEIELMKAIDDIHLLNFYGYTSYTIVFTVAVILSQLFLKELTEYLLIGCLASCVGVFIVDLIFCLITKIKFKCFNKKGGKL